MILAFGSTVQSLSYVLYHANSSLARKFGGFMDSLQSNKKWGILLHLQ